MSVMVKNSLGRWVQVAGQGKAEYGASTVRRGTIGVPAIAANVDYADQTITFSTPMPDADYLIDLSLQGSNTHRVAFHVVANTKTVNGFTVRFTPIGVKQITGVGVQGVADSLSYTLTVERDSTYPNLSKNTAIVDPTASLPNDWNAMQTGYLKNPMPANEATLVYTAFKLYTDTEYNNLLNNAVLTSDVTDSVTNGDLNPVTSNAVYDAMNVIQSGTGTRNESYVRSDGFYCIWHKVGKICIVNIQYNLSQLTSSDVEIITGLPKPVTEVASVGEGDSNTSVSSFVVKMNGAVRTHYEGASGQFVHGTVTYITAD